MGPINRCTISQQPPASLWETADLNPQTSTVCFLWSDQEQRRQLKCLLHIFDTVKIFSTSCVKLWKTLLLPREDKLSWFMWVLILVLVLFHHPEVTSPVSVNLLTCISHISLSVSASSAFNKQRFQISGLNRVSWDAANQEISLLQYAKKRCWCFYLGPRDGRKLLQEYSLGFLFFLRSLRENLWKCKIRNKKMY